MIGTKERKKQNGDTIVSVKNRNNDPEFSHNPCGGCNACHQMTGIHNKTSSPTWGGTGDGEKGPNLQRACATNFFQRNLGNNYLQSMAGGQHAIRQPSRNSIPTIQRKCACGGSCASCSEEEEGLKIQTKLTIGAANDIYEQEADQVAEQVMRMTDSSGHTKNHQPHAGISIQRISTSGSSTMESAPDFQLNQSGGQPLSPSTRQFMEPRFGVDFSHVQLHSDQDAHQTAAQIQARAFTYGHHIWLGRGDSESDSTLMAHELTHVVQQGAASLTDQVSPTGVSKDMSEPQVQRARLPCTNRTTVDVYPVNLPGSTRTINDDLATTNSILCQCGIDINVKGGESWDTNLLDQEPPVGVLNAPAGTVRPLTAEENIMLSYKPGGADVIHVYYVPSFSGPKVAEAFWPSQHGEKAIAVSNAPNADSLPHEIGHVLLDNGSHLDSKPDNLMASGNVRNIGVDELEQSQCNRMP